MSGFLGFRNSLLSQRIRIMISPEFINTLSDNEIFVFGSNESGIHGLGAAKQALKWGAVRGQAEGLQGRTYGIPTKDKTIRRTLSTTEIKPYVDRFILYAKTNPQYIFLVTEIGCGLAGLNPSQVAPLFIEALGINNIYLPKRFINNLKTNDRLF